MEILSFLMKGRFGHFCSPFTNVYRLTQPCPTKTAILGFVGSILGNKKDDLNLFDKIRCGVEIYGNYRTISMPYLSRQGFSGSASNNKSSRTSVEVIVNPAYKVYVCGYSEILQELFQRMNERNPVFTPYLGLAQFLASTDYQPLLDKKAEQIANIDADVNGAFIREIHGEMDFERLNIMSGEKFRITEFEGLKGIKPSRQFEHATFTINLTGGITPLKAARNLLYVPAWNKYVPVF